MFPYKDDNPTLRTPIVTFVLIGMNAAVWVLVQGMGAEGPLIRSVCDLGLIPGEFLGRIPPGTIVPAGGGASCVIEHQGAWWSLLSSMFLHGSWFHLIGNMWFLYLFGNNVEDSMGRIRYLIFYLLCGLAAGLSQTAINPSSAIPMVGASGAIGGVMGAYVVLYPRVQIHMFIFLFIFITRIVVPAFWMLGYWFVLQLFGGWGSIGAEGGGTAFWAHVGGFAAGAALILVFRDPQLVAEHRAHLRNWTRGHFRDVPY